MPLVAVGTVLLLLKILDIAPVSGLDWAWVLSPFGLAVAWWLYSDMSGLTQRKAMRKMEERKVARRERDMVALGLSVDKGRGRRVKAAQKAAQKASDAAGGPKGP